MLKIQSGPEDLTSITYWLSGRIQSENLVELGALLEAECRRVILDLKEVTLVSCEAVRFLGACESRGTELVNCPAYVRRWIARERCLTDRATIDDTGIK